MSTIKEIAKRAGVSPTTVSNVINGNTKRVSPETRLRVEQILQQENYTPNMAAHILGQNSSRIVGVIMFMEARRHETVIEDPFSSSILGSIETELRKHGYYMMLHTTADPDEILRLTKAWKLAGLVLLWVPCETIAALKDGIQKPIVFIDSHTPGEEFPYRSVGLEDRNGGYLVTRYLLSMGHSNLLFLANDSMPCSSDVYRFSGCRAALEESGFELREDRYLSLSKDPAERKKLYQRLATKPYPHTALVFSADYYAAEAISILQDLGVRVPEDISVTGFDDNIFSRLIKPKITTVHQDVPKKGQVAIDMLVQAINKEHIDEEHIELPVHLEVRDSVGAIGPSLLNP